MCYNIATQSVHCDDTSHRDWRKVRCQKFWFADWEVAATCKDQRDMCEESTEECKMCKEYAQRKPAEPWDLEAEVTSTNEPGSGCEGDSSEASWDWSDFSSSDDEAIDRSELVDEDIILTEEEALATQGSKTLSIRLAETLS